MYYLILESKTVNDMRHPDYLKSSTIYGRHRRVIESGDEFIDQYLKTFSKREEWLDFANRKDMTYCPAHAKAAIYGVRDMIFGRMCDIRRSGLPQIYQTVITGENGGVNKRGASLNSFIGLQVLLELLAMGKVAVFIDRASTLKSRRDELLNLPYMYIYRAEEVLGWKINEETQRYEALLVSAVKDTVDPDTGLVVSKEPVYRLYKKRDNTVILREYNTIHDDIAKPAKISELTLPEIPCVSFQLNQSLLTDIARHQITLLNLASSDIDYAIRGNIPYYTEQFDPNTESEYLNRTPNEVDADRSAGEEDTVLGTEAKAAIAKEREMAIGTGRGRRYAKGLDRPAFINPSSEPLRASMTKQDSIVEEIRILINLALRNIRPVRASAESKARDDRSAENGLASIALEIESGEREVAVHWAAYDNDKSAKPQIVYPLAYDVKTIEDRIAEAKSLKEVSDEVVSPTFKKKIQKEMVKIVAGAQASQEELTLMESEIDQAVVLTANPEDIRKDHEQGLVSDETASIARGYPTGEASKAQTDHAVRLSRIIEAQSNASKARGNPDGLDDSVDEKTRSQNQDTNLDGQKKAVRS